MDYVNGYELREAWAAIQKLSEELDIVKKALDNLNKEKEVVKTN